MKAFDTPIQVAISHFLALNTTQHNFSCFTYSSIKDKNIQAIQPASAKSAALSKRSVRGGGLQKSLSFVSILDLA